MTMSKPSKEVMRCVKQVYTHLKIRDKIPDGDVPVTQLSKDIHKMQLLWQTDPKEFKRTVLGFLSWKPSNNEEKTLNHFIERLENAISSFCFVPEDLDDYDSFESTSPPPSSSTTLRKRQANDDDIDSPVKKIRSQSTTSNSTLCSTASDGKSPITPPMSPPVSSNDESDANANENTLYVPLRSVQCFKGIDWSIQYEIARFLRTFNINDPPFELLQRLLDVAKHEPRNLFQSMMEWYANQPSKVGSNVHLGLMDRCSDQIWTHVEKLTSSSSSTRAIHYKGMIALSSFKAPAIELRPPRVGASNRFSRKYGDHRFLELKLNRASHVALVKKNKDYFLKPFILMGRTYRFLFVKDDTIILFATEGLDLEPISIRQVINWHIPILDNWEMTISKFASRMSLGYSNSIPTLVFKPENVQYIDDLSSGADGDEETCMTDGCGLISVSAMRKIMGCERADTLPCAVQGRIGGAKGVWIVAPDLDFNSGEWIQIRKSQHKFKTGGLQYNMEIDPLHYTFDLVKNSICLYPSNLNTQFIQCLSSCGVPTSVFIDLLTEYLDRLTREVAENRNPRLLRDWAAKTGGIMRNRWEAEDTEKDVWREQTEDLLDTLVDADADTPEPPTYKRNDSYWRYNQYSGNPSSLHEGAVRLLDSGFDTSNPHLANKITQIFNDVMRSVSIKYKIEVEQSCTITCVPDPTGILNEGEVFLQLSNRRVDEKTGIQAGLVVGDIIVARNPCGLKSDVQKVKAVDRPELRIYTDVIIFPIKGQRSLASMLAGGDYDGDIVFCCWDPRIVEPFTSSPVPETPAAMKTVFIKNDTKVRQELIKHRDNDAQEVAIQTNFLNVSLPDGTLGQYENWRTVLAESRSLDDPDVVYLAHMCAKLVDAPKQGLSLKPAVLQRDRSTFGSVPHPLWFVNKRNKQRERDYKSYQEVNQDVLPSKTLGTAMDYLHKLLHERTEAFTNFTDHVIDDDEVKLKDPDLLAPWEEAEKMAKDINDKDFMADLELIKQQVQTLYINYVRDVKDVVFTRQRRRDSRYDPVRETEPFIREYSGYNTLFELEEHYARQFLAIPSTIKSNVLKIDQKLHHGHMTSSIVASAAYIRTIQAQKYNKFCYVVAFDTIRRMKADAHCKKTKDTGYGYAESIIPYMYAPMTMSKSWIKKLRGSKSAADAGTAMNK
ncbi:RdRP-domain-containing protein [Lichtheimia hyalospora FSU 10163]|nr:RdRP-domain-containing protein [Lichtheimia hyalospora FSU 10163]